MSAPDLHSLISPARRQRPTQLGDELISRGRDRRRKRGEERIDLSGCLLQHLRMIPLGPFKDAARDLLQRGTLRNPRDLKNLRDHQVLIAPTPAQRLHTERSDNTAHAARIQPDEPGRLGERRERANPLAARMSNGYGHTHSLAQDTATTADTEIAGKRGRRGAGVQGSGSADRSRRCLDSSARLQRDRYAHGGKSANKVRTRAPENHDTPKLANRPNPSNQAETRTPLHPPKTTPDVS